MNDTIEISAEDLAEMRAELASLRAEVAATPAIAIKTTLQMTPKGCLQLKAQGLRKFGASFYADEWAAILANADAIKTFLAGNNVRNLRG